MSIRLTKPPLTSTGTSLRELVYRFRFKTLMLLKLLLLQRKVITNLTESTWERTYYVTSLGYVLRRQRTCRVPMYFPIFPCSTDTRYESACYHPNELIVSPLLAHCSSPYTSGRFGCTRTRCTVPEYHPTEYPQDFGQEKSVKISGTAAADIWEGMRLFLSS